MKVSIVTPVYNQDKYVNETVNSVLCQTYQNLEYIIINDGSTDDSERMISNFKDKRIKYISQENQGQSYTLNKGWEIASGEIISYLSADDLIEPTLVEKSVKLFNKSSEIILTFPDFNFINKESNKIGENKNGKFSKRKV